MACCVTGESPKKETSIDHLQSGQYRELCSWFERSLRQERQELEARHQLVLAELAFFAKKFTDENAHQEQSIVISQSCIREESDSGAVALETDGRSYMASPAHTLPPADALLPADALNDAATVTPELQSKTATPAESQNGHQEKDRGREELNAAEELKQNSALVKEARDKACTRGTDAKKIKRRSTATFVSNSEYVSMTLDPRSWAKSTVFDTMFCLVIVVNTLIMAFEVEYRGMQIGYEINFQFYEKPKEVMWPGAGELFEFCEVMFGILFTVELCLKFLAFRHKLLCDLWAYLDIVIVLAFIAESIMGSLPLDANILRLARLARLLRLLRLVRTIQGFDSLYVMTTALKACLPVLFWTFLLLTVVQLMIGFMLNQFVMVMAESESTDPAVKIELFRYFGTTSRSMLTMFELTLANWPPVARLLQDEVSELYVVFSIFHKLTIGFAVIGVINGVFMQETFKVANSDDIIMMRQTERTRKLHMKKMDLLFKHADSSGDGLLAVNEFREVMDDPQVKTWLAAQELNVSDADVLFELICGRDEELSAEGLVAGVGRLKGPARSFDLAILQMQQRVSQEALVEVMQQLNRICSKEQKDLES
eukprot:gb/GFBE01083210.1/.p1 GENE.gb/GFBE01083210.1/~~gb/GFBE01083210.1/.p1  ORF type:complete len:598 (+),score=137.89 gb/GFBE01083210.1/:1-1794(+)